MDWRHELGAAIEKAMRDSGLTKEQMADVLRQIAMNLTRMAAEENGPEPK